MGSTRKTRSRTSCAFNMRISQPLPACVHSLHHLRTYPRTVLRNLPSVQWFVSAQVLQPALTAAPRRLQPIPVPTLITPSPNKNLPPLHRAHSLDSTTLHLLAILSLFEYISSADVRDHRSPQRAHLPSAPCPRYPPLPLSLSLSLDAPTFLSLTLSKTESCKKRSRRKVSVQPQGSLLLLSHPNKDRKL